MIRTVNIANLYNGDGLGSLWLHDSKTQVGTTSQSEILEIEYTGSNKQHQKSNQWG